MATIKVVNMTPNALSSAHGQDSEPSLAVNPEKPNQMVATAFTPDPLGGQFAPVYVSTDGGDSWVLNSVVPGNSPGTGTGDISVGFPAQGGTLFTGTLNGQTHDLQILRAPDITSATPMEVVVDRGDEDQPWVVADTVTANGLSSDRVYVGNNNAAQEPRPATVDVSADARTAPAPAGFAPVQLERRAGVIHDGPPVRIAVHSDGTVYSAFESWTNFVNKVVTFDVVVTRDDKGGIGPNPFEDLLDSADGGVGQRVVTQRSVRFDVQVGSLGQERIGADLAIALSPADSNNVWVAWCDGTGGAVRTDYVLHVQHSADRGQTWAAAREDIVNGKNPSLAVNSGGLVGLVYQQFADNQWRTTLEVTADNWQTGPETTVLHQAPADVPAARGLPYLGDYIRLLAVGSDFYGVFSGNNTPDNSNFPVGVTYQRNADFTTHQLLHVDGTPGVPVSIDPFFFHRAA